MSRPNAASSEPSTKRKDGRGNHLWNTLRKHARPVISRRPLVAFGKGVRAFFPWSIVDYPGIERGAVELMQSRVTHDTIRDWRIGRRRPPPWAWALLAAALDKRIAEMTHWRDIAKKEANPTAPP